MKPPLPPDRVAALLKTHGAAANHRKFSRLDNLGRRARKVLNEDEVRDIRARWNAGEKLESIAHDYGVTMPCVSMIGTGQRRAEVKP